MDINRLYPTAGTVGFTGSLKYTALIQSIPITDTPFPDSYNLGFIRHWFPQLQTTQISYNADTAEYTLNDITDYDTYPSVGYGIKNTGTGGQYPENYFYDVTNGKFDYSTYGTHRLANNFYPQGTSMGSVGINYLFLGHNTNSYPYPQNLTLSIDQFLHFLNDGTSLTFTDNYTLRTYTLTRADFTDDCYYDIDTSIRLLISGYEFGTNWYNENGTEFQNKPYPQIFMYSNYKLLDTSYSSITFGELINVQSSGNCRIYPTTGTPRLQFAYLKNVLHSGESGGVITSPFVGRASGKFIASAVMTGVGKWTVIDADTTNATYAVEIRNASQYGVGIFTAIRFEEIYKNAALYRWTLTPTYGYGDGTNVWYPKINLATNEFELELIQGTQAEIDPQLPLWYRLNSPQVNTFADDDKPSPAPPAPSDDEITTDKHNAENSLPALSGIRTVSGDAFSTFYHLSMYHVAELGRLISQMPQSFWEALGTATDYKQANILDYLVSLKWYPLNITDSTDTVTSDLQFGFNGVAKITFTAAGTSYKIGNINRIYDMGTIAVPYRATAQSFLDLEPYTTVSAYLPYIGTVSLQANDVVGYTITCKYIIDLTTGMCTGILDNGTDTIYIGTGKIGVDISVSGNDILTQSEKMASSYIGAASSAVTSTLSLVASTTAEDAAGMIAASTSAVANIATSAIGIANAKRGIPETVGSASGFGGGYTHQSPYIRVQRPAVSIPGKYGHDIGYVCNRSYTIGTLSGYTVCSNPDLSGIPATSEELDMIRSLLMSGFYA